MLLPGQLLPCNLKPLLMQLKVCPPQLVRLMSNLNTLALPACSRLRNSALHIRVITGRGMARAIAFLLAAATGRTGVTAVDGEVSPPVLLVLNLTQLKSRGIRLWKRLSHMKPVLSMTRQEQ